MHLPVGWTRAMLIRMNLRWTLTSVHINPPFIQFMFLLYESHKYYLIIKKKNEEEKEQRVNRKIEK
jgi:hypothetical protein